ILFYARRAYHYSRDRHSRKFHKRNDINGTDNFAMVLCGHFNGPSRDSGNGRWCCLPHAQKKRAEVGKKTSKIIRQIIEEKRVLKPSDLLFQGKSAMQNKIYNPTTTNS